MLLNCGVGEDSWESLGLWGDPTSSILKEISPEYSLEGLMLKLKLQYFGPLMPRTDSLEKTLILGKDWRQEEKVMTEDEMVGWHHWHDGREFEEAPGVGDGQVSLACYSSWGCKVGHDWVIELNWSISLIFSSSSWRAHRLELLYHSWIHQRLKTKGIRERQHELHFSKGK